MFQLNVRSFLWDSDENVKMPSRMNELVSWSLMNEKFRSFVKKMLWVEKTSGSGWEVWVFILGKVFSLEKLGWNGKTWKNQAKSSFLSKNSSRLSLLGFSHSLQSEMVKMRLIGSKIGVYIDEYRWRETQESLYNLIKTLGNIVIFPHHH